jgi:hypothetical protein
VGDTEEKQNSRPNRTVKVYDLNSILLAYEIQQKTKCKIKWEISLRKHSGELYYSKEAAAQHSKEAAPQVILSAARLGCRSAGAHAFFK